MTVGAPASIGGGDSLTLSSNISGSFDLAKTGAGDLSLSAASAGFTGLFFVEDGTVHLLAANALPNSIIEIAGPGILPVGINNALRNSDQDVTVKNGGLLTVSDGFTTNYRLVQCGEFIAELESLLEPIQSPFGD